MRISRKYLPVFACAVLLSACLASETSNSVEVRDQQDSNYLSVELDQPSGLIIHTTKPPQTLNREISSMSQYGAIEYVLELNDADSEILRPSRSMETIAYAIFGDLPTGTRVTTRWTVSRPTLSSDYSEEYSVVVGQNDSRNPYLVLNGQYNENPGTFVFELFVDGRRIASSTKRYNVGLN